MLKRLIAAAPLLLFAALGVMFAFKSLHRNPQITPDALVGKPLPAAAMAPLDGGPALPASAAAGTTGPYLINFFASWCGPCAEEAPTLMALKAKGVHMVGVNYEDTPQKARAFLDKYGDPFAVHLADPQGRAGIEYGVSGVPETFLVGSDGTVLAKVSVPMTAQDAEKLLAKAR